MKLEHCVRCVMPHTKPDLHIGYDLEAAAAVSPELSTPLNAAGMPVRRDLTS